MPIIPLWGRGVKGKSNNITAQRRLNLYTERAIDEPLDFALFGRPGASLLTRYNSGLAFTPATPASGLFCYDYRFTSGTYTEYGSAYRETHSEGWYGGRYANEILPSGVAAGDAAPGPAPVEMSFNGNTIFAVNGGSAWYASASSPGTTGLDAIVSGAFPWGGATSVTYIASRFVVNYPPVAGRFCWSPLNAFTGTAWGGLDYAAAESAPDALVAVRAHRNELVLFGADTIEFWTPDATTVFSRISGATQQVGLAAQFSLQSDGQSLYFLSRQPNSKPQVVMMQGYQWKRISDPNIETIILNDGIDLPAITSSLFTVGGHTFYVMNLSKTSLVYDITEQTWAEWQTEGSRWCVQWVAYGMNNTLIGTDYRNGNVYTIDPDTFTDNGQPIIREFQSRHVLPAELDRATVWELTVDMEESSTTTDISLTDPNYPDLMLQISRDGGHTFGSEMWTTLGNIGKYLQRAVWRRLGRGRDFVFRLRTSARFKFVAVRATIRVGS